MSANGCADPPGNIRSPNGSAQVPYQQSVMYLRRWNRDGSPPLARRPAPAILSSITAWKATLFAVESRRSTDQSALIAVRLTRPASGPTPSRSHATVKLRSLPSRKPPVDRRMVVITRSGATSLDGHDRRPRGSERQHSMNVDWVPGWASGGQDALLRGTGVGSNRAQLPRVARLAPGLPRTLSSPAIHDRTWTHPFPNELLGPADSQAIFA